MVSHHPAKSGGHRQCDKGDIMFLVVEKQDFTCSCLSHPIIIYLCLKDTN